jgi:hypothetical protein
MGLPQLLACLDVKERHDKENYGEQQHQCILHRESLGSGRNSADFVQRGRYVSLGATELQSLEVLTSEPVILHKNDSGLCQL